MIASARARSRRRRWRRFPLAAAARLRFGSSALSDYRYRRTRSCMAKAASRCNFFLVKKLVVTITPSGGPMLFESDAVLRTARMHALIADPSPRFRLSARYRRDQRRVGVLKNSPCCNIDCARRLALKLGDRLPQQPTGHVHLVLSSSPSQPHRGADARREHQRRGLDDPARCRRHRPFHSSPELGLLFITVRFWGMQVGPSPYDANPPARAQHRRPLWPSPLESLSGDPSCQGSTMESGPHLPRRRRDCRPTRGCRITVSRCLPAVDHPMSWGRRFNRAPDRPGPSLRCTRHGIGGESSSLPPAQSVTLESERQDHEDFRQRQRVTRRNSPRAGGRAFPDHRAAQLSGLWQQTGWSYPPAMIQRLMPSLSPAEFPAAGRRRCHRKGGGLLSPPRVLDVRGSRCGPNCASCRASPGPR